MDLKNFAVAGFLALTGTALARPSPAAASAAATKTPTGSALLPVVTSATALSPIVVHGTLILPRVQQTFSPPASANGRGRLHPEQPSPLGLPTRIRLPSGVEIDRIGNTCYAVPPSKNALPGTNQSVLPRAMFAHEVSCLPGELLSMSDDFLEHLRKRLGQSDDSRQ